MTLGTRAPSSASKGFSMVMEQLCNVYSVQESGAWMLDYLFFDVIHSGR